jgi:hypothetical protein
MKAKVFNNISPSNAIPGHIINIRDDGVVIQTGIGSVISNLSTSSKEPLSDIMFFCVTNGIQ